MSNATVCSGTSAVLTASNATTYSWNTSATTNSISVTPTVNTTYTVTGTTNGCTNTKTVSVTVKATPTVAVSNATICSGASAVLTASNATTYSWNTSATTNSISVTPTVNTTYTVTGTTNGCTNTKTVSVTVKATPIVVASNTTACSGNAVIVSASGATTYSWSTSATTNTISVTPSVTTTYTVRGTTNGCFTVKTVTVTVATTPVANAGPSKTITCATSTVSLNGSGVSTYTWTGPGIISGGNTANPVVGTAGTYTLRGSNSGCTSSPVTVLVSANAGIPSVAASASGSINCTILTASVIASTTASPVTYAWSGTGITSGTSASSITVNQGGVFNYTVTNTGNGCKATGSQTVLQNTTSPTVSLDAISGPLCLNSSAISLSGNPTGGIYSGAGVSGASFDPSVAGTGTIAITYDYTDANGCSGSDVQSVTVNVCTGISELNNNVVSVYPNPANDQLYVKLDASLINNTTIELYDAIGKLVAKEKVINEITSFSLSQLTKGIYSIRVIFENNQSVIRIIKE